jgi:hypothetical protein
MHGHLEALQDEARQLLRREGRFRCPSLLDEADDLLGELVRSPWARPLG